MAVQVVPFTVVIGSAGVVTVAPLWATGLGVVAISAGIGWAISQLARAISSRASPQDEADKLRRLLPRQKFSRNQIACN